MAWRLVNSAKAPLSNLSYTLCAVQTAQDKNINCILIKKTFSILIIIIDNFCIALFSGVPKLTVLKDVVQQTIPTYIQWAWVVYREIVNRRCRCVCVVVYKFIVSEREKEMGLSGILQNITEHELCKFCQMTHWLQQKLAQRFHISWYPMKKTHCVSYLLHLFTNHGSIQMKWPKKLPSSVTDFLHCIADCAQGISPIFSAFSIIYNMHVSCLFIYTDTKRDSIYIY